MEICNSEHAADTMIEQRCVHFHIGSREHQAPVHLRIFTLLSIHYKQSWSDTAYMFGCKINCLHHHNASNGGSAELLIENLIKHNTCDIIIKPDPRSTTQSHFFSTYLASGLHCDRL